jgi:predicted RNA-binding Zn-ribbon protein involved in translation (DUF1610 family)
MSPSDDVAERERPLKATLYCPNCDHASRINGNWIIEIHTDHLDYECPRCGTLITSRRDESELHTRCDGTLQFGNAD